MVTVLHLDTFLVYTIPLSMQKCLDVPSDKLQDVI